MGWSGLQFKWLTKIFTCASLKINWPDLLEGSDHAPRGEDVPHVLAGEGHLIGQLQQPAKLHPSLDTLDGVRVEVGESLSLQE